MKNSGQFLKGGAKLYLHSFNSVPVLIPSDGDPTIHQY